MTTDLTPRQTRSIALVWTAMAFVAALARQLPRALLAFSLMLGLSLAQAAVNVSGTLNSDTTWTAAQSPYVLHGDVVLDNNATLTIQPGVQVRMAAGASFTLRQGALQAVGTASSPIVITSDAATPQPGDWRQWRFTSGTRSAHTVLEHVQMSYGSGLVVEGSAPVLNHLSLQNHSGPAIRIDLAASPTGRHLSASGNALNAIAVPAGTIRSQVVWGLVGIPYLVQQGIVQIGQSPLSLEPARLRLSPGVVAILRLATSAPAPAGGLGIDLTSSVPSVASVASRASVPGGQYGADVEVQAHAVGTTSITASHASLGSAAAFVEVMDLPALELVPTAPTIGVQRPYAMTLRTPQVAPAGGLSVTLGNSDSAVLRAPSSLLVPAGQQSVSFEVTGLTDGTSRLSAQADGLATGLSTVTVRGKALVLPNSIVVAPGAQTQSTVQLTEPAPAGGLTVNLRSAATGTATVPASAHVPAGASQASFNVSGVALGTTTLTASANAYQGTQTTVRVDAIALDLEPVGDLVLNVEQSLTRRVQLSKPAPPGGVMVNVAIEDATLATVSPAEVFVPEGQVFGLTPLTIKGMDVGQSKLNLTAPGLIRKAVNVNVREKVRLRFVVQGNRDKVTAGKGLRTLQNELYVERLINGQAAGGAEPLTVNLRCVVESICTVPAKVTIPANQSYAYVQVTGVELGTTQIEATAGGADTATPIPVEVIAPQVVFSSLDDNRTTASVRDNFQIQLRVPGAYWPNHQYPIQPLTINLSLTDQSPAGVVNGIYTASTGGTLTTQVILPIDTAYTGWLYVAQPSQAGTYRVSAEVPGITSGQSEVQTVTAGSQALRFVVQGNRDKVTAGKGLRTLQNELYVERLINGQVAGGAEPLTVNLRCVVESVCTVPATVTIPANRSYAYVQVTGVELGTTQIEATAGGADEATPMAVEVIAPQVVFHDLDGNRNTASVRDNFRIQLRTPGANWADHQYPAQPLTINLGLVDQSPAGVVNGIYTASTGGELITQVVLPINTSATGWLYVAQPSQAGTYRVSAEVPGITSGQSEVQTVTAGSQALRLVVQGNRGKVTAGKGLRTLQNELYVERLINGQAAGGAEPLTVNLRCVVESICTVPATVTIPANQSYAYVQVTGVELGTTQIEATAGGADTATPIPVEVIAPQVVFSSLDDNRTTASVRDNFQIQLRVPGAYWPNHQYPIQPLTINLSLTDQSPAGVVNGIYTASTGGGLITQVVLPINTSATGWLHVAQPSQTGTYRVSAEIPGIANGQSEVQTVTAAAQGLRLTVQGNRSKAIVGKGLRTDRNELYVERVINGQVTGGADPVVVNLRCVAESVCSVPATVTIPANQYYAYVQVTGIDIGSTQIEATAAGFDAGAITTETVTPALRFYTEPPTTLQAGRTYGSIRVASHVPGAYYADSQTAVAPIRVTLTSAIPSAATVTPQVDWVLNQNYTGVAILTGVAPGTTRLTASAPGFTPATSRDVTITP